MKNQNLNTKTPNKKPKVKWVKINAVPGSIIVVPKELEAFKKRGINLLTALKNLQKEIYKNE